MSLNSNNGSLTGTALYSLPESSVFHEVSGPVTKIQASEIYNEPGFILAPYDLNEFPIYRIAGQPHESDISKKIFSELRETPYSDQPSRESYQETFDQALEAIRSGIINKMVLSIRHREKKNIFNEVRFLKRLRKAYPSAFIYLVYIENQEFWIGASPELLLDTQYPFQRTVALAGTLSEAPDIKDWAEKEKEEHRYVEVFLEKKLEDRPFRKEGPFPIQAGPIYHLQTRYYLQIESTPLNPTEIHPSPALSGYPVRESMKLIHSIEPHSRRYYTGFLGPVWNSGHNRFFINLRSLEVFRDELVLYAGGGLTQDSDSDKEWMEIQHKLSTLRSKFHKGEKHNDLR